MATATIDVRGLGAGFTANVFRRGVTTALNEVERRIKRDHDKMNAPYGTDYDAAVGDCLAVVAAVRTDAESAPLPEDDPPAAPQWLDAPTCDGLWWRCDSAGRVWCIRVVAYCDCETPPTFGVDQWRGCEVSVEGPSKWLRVDVPEAPR